MFCKEVVNEDDDLIGDRSEIFVNIADLNSIINTLFSLKEMVDVCKLNNIDNFP